MCSVTTAIFLKLGTDELYCVTKGINPLWERERERERGEGSGRGFKYERGTQSP